MPSLVLVKLPGGKLRGWSEEDEKAYQKFKRAIEGLVDGECIRFEWKPDRNGVKHRKYFAMLTLAFEAWDPGRNRKRLTFKGKPIGKNFERFREMVQIQAGYYEQYFDLHGRMKLEAKSIAYDKMGDDEFNRLYDDVTEVILNDVLVNYGTAELQQVVDEIARMATQH